MGIKGLLAALKPFTRPVHVSEYAGQRVGIDAYSWLHKGAYACSMELCEQGGGSWQWAGGANAMAPFVKYCMHRINMLRYNKVIPVVVFDGGHLPLKAATEHERRRRREKSLELARYKLSQGDTVGATELFQRAVDVSPAMANELIKVLRAAGVEFIVAPYEADAQLAWLSKLEPLLGGVSTVISEDSDLLTYGCSVVLFKMDKCGNGEEIRQQVLFSQEPQKPKDLSFRKLTRELFVGMCVMAGCDFLPSIPGIGVKKAHALIAKYCKLERVLSTLQVEKKALVPEGYVADFNQAIAIFRYARVYDARKHALTFLNPLPRGFESSYGGCIDFLGPEIPPSRAKAIALGLMDPITMCAFDAGNPITMCAAPRAPAINPQRNLVHLPICSPTSVLDRLEVVDLSDSEDTADCFILSGRSRVESGISMALTEFVPESTTPIAELPPEIAGSTPAPDMNFLAQLQHIAFDMRAERTGVSDSAHQEVPATCPQNNPFKRQKVVETNATLLGSPKRLNLETYPEFTDGSTLRSCSTAADTAAVLYSDAVSTEDLVRVKLGHLATPAPAPDPKPAQYKEHEQPDAPTQITAEYLPMPQSPALISWLPRRVPATSVPCSPLAATAHGSSSSVKENKEPGRDAGPLLSRVKVSSPAVLHADRKPMKPTNGKTLKKQVTGKEKAAGGGIRKFFQPISK